MQEVAVPASTVPGEEAWPTQLVPLKPRPLVRQSLDEADLTNITPESHAYALKEFRKYLSGSIYTPPSLQGTITTPGHLGGAEWHGASFDQALNVLYVNVNEVPTINRLRPVHDTEGESLSPAALGQRIFERTCAACHGIDRQGTPAQAPALVGSEWLAVRGYRQADGTRAPVCKTEYYINRAFAAVGRLLQRHSGPIFPLIEDLFGVSVVEVHQEISAIATSRELADLLKVETGSAALEMQRTYTTSDGEIAQVTVNTHPSARYRHSMTMRRVKG